MTRIFPNRVEPLACPFQRQQLASLARLCEVEVLAAIPYHPGVSLLGERTRPGRLTAVPDRDEIDGISVAHPRAPYLPGAGSVLAPVNVPLYLAGLLPHVPRLRGRFDVVLGAYLFPDACAAAVLARMLGIPHAVKGHGTDVNVVARWRSVRPIIGAALRSAACAIGVSRPMVDALVELGASPDRAALVRNGVDRSLFAPGDRAEARRALGLPQEGRIITYVGRLDKLKGVHELLAAFGQIAAEQGEAPGSGVQPVERWMSARPLTLVFVGDGPERPAVEQAARSGGAGQVILAGARPLPEVARYLAAGDLLALPSYAEGTPNVVLEALAAARPVVATTVGGIPDVVVHGRTGLLVPPRDVPALAAALRDALSRSWDEREFADTAPPSWDESASVLRDLLAWAAFGPPDRLAA